MEKKSKRNIHSIFAEERWTSKKRVIHIWENKKKKRKGGTGIHIEKEKKAEVRSAKEIVEGLGKTTTFSLDRTATETFEFCRKKT